MNDLNLLVSHALSAVRDAQQSVRDGDMGTGDEAPPLLANFADVMQGLIALAQTAPQTEDAFDYAKTALLQKLAKDKAEGDALPIDITATQDVENEDGATEILIEENDASEEGARSDPSPLAAAFAPLQETIASLLMAHAPASAGTELTDAVVAHVMQAAGRVPQPISADTQAAPSDVGDASAQPTANAQAQAAADAAQQAAGGKGMQQMSNAGGESSTGQVKDLQALQSQQVTQQNQLQATDAMLAATAPPSAEPTMIQPAAQEAVGMQAVVAQQPENSSAPASDTVEIAAQTPSTQPAPPSESTLAQQAAQPEPAGPLQQAVQTQQALVAAHTEGPKVAATDSQLKVQAMRQQQQPKPRRPRKPVPPR